MLNNDEFWVNKPGFSQSLWVNHTFAQRENGLICRWDWGPIAFSAPQRQTNARVFIR